MKSSFGHQKKRLRPGLHWQVCRRKEKSPKGHFIRLCLRAIRKGLLALNSSVLGGKCDLSWWPLLPCEEPGGVIRMSLWSLLKFFSAVAASVANVPSSSISEPKKKKKIFGFEINRSNDELRNHYDNSSNDEFLLEKKFKIKSQNGTKQDNNVFKSKKSSLKCPKIFKQFCLSFS